MVKSCQKKNLFDEVQDKGGGWQWHSRCTAEIEATQTSMMDWMDDERVDRHLASVPSVGGYQAANHVTASVPRSLLNRTTKPLAGVESNIQWKPAGPGLGIEACTHDVWTTTLLGAE